MCKIDARDGTENLVTISAAVLEIYRKVWRGAKNSPFPTRARVNPSQKQIQQKLPQCVQSALETHGAEAQYAVCSTDRPDLCTRNIARRATPTATPTIKRQAFWRGTAARPCIKVRPHKRLSPRVVDGCYTHC